MAPPLGPQLASAAPRRSARWQSSLFIRFGCWILLFMLLPIFVFIPPFDCATTRHHRAVALGRTRLHAAGPVGEDASEAELDLAEAKAAAARAKAELAEAQARSPSAKPAADGDAAATEVEVRPYTGTPVAPARSVATVRIFSGDAYRPGDLFYSSEGIAFFELLAGLENIPVGRQGQTALDATLRAVMLLLYTFATAGRSSRLETQVQGVPADVLRDAKELGSALTADSIASALAPQDRGGDWRELVQILGNVKRFPDILESALDWNTFFPDIVERSTGIRPAESKVRFLTFFRGAAFQEAGTWSDAELDAAKRLIASDSQLQKVFARADIVRGSLGDFISKSFVLPILALVFLTATVCFLCFGISKDPNFGGSSNPPAGTDLQTLPLFKLDK